MDIEIETAERDEAENIELTKRAQIFSIKSTATLNQLDKTRSVEDKDPGQRP